MERAHVLVRLRGDAAPSSAAGICRTSASTVRLEHSEMSPGVASISFEQVFDVQDSNAHVFQTSITPAVDAAVDGKAATLVATGAASSGKSFACHGDQHKPRNGQAEPGLITLAIRRIFSELERKLSDGWKCNVLLSCWGVDASKNEALTDLLASGTSVPVQDMEKLLVDRSVAVQTPAEAVHLYSRALGRVKEQETQDFVVALHVETLSPSGEARRGRLLVVDLQGGSIIEPRGDVVNQVEKKERAGCFLDAHFPVNETLSAGFGAFVGGTSATYLVVAIQTPAQFQQQAIQSLLYACKAKEIKYCSRINYLSDFIEKKNTHQLVENQKRLSIEARNQAPGCREDFIAPEAPGSVVSTDRCVAFFSERFLSASPPLSTASSDSTCELPFVAPPPRMSEAPELPPSLSPSTSCESEEQQRQSDISRRVRKAYDLAKAATSSPSAATAAFEFTSSQEDVEVHGMLAKMLKHLPRDTLQELTLQAKLEQICTAQIELERALAHETSIKDKCVDRISRLSQTMSCQVVEHEQQLQEALTAKHAAEAQLQELNIKFDGVGREVSRLQAEVQALKGSQYSPAHSENMQNTTTGSDHDRTMLHTLSARLEEAMIQAKDVITFKDGVIQSLEERLQLASKRGAGAVKLLAEERSRFDREKAQLLELMQTKNNNQESEDISRVQTENMTLQQQKADLTVKVAQLALELETARSQWAQEAHDREVRAEQRCAKQVARAEQRLEQATSAMQQQMAQFRNEFDMKIARQRVAGQVACKAGELKCDQLERDLQRMKLKLAKQKVKLEKKARALVANAHQQHEEPLAVLQRETEDLSVRMETILQQEQNALRRAYKSEETVDRLRTQVQQLKASSAELEQERAALRNLCKELEVDKKSLETEHGCQMRELEESLAKQVLAAEARVHEERDRQMQRLMEEHSTEEKRLKVLITAAEQEKAVIQVARQQSTSSVTSRASSTEDGSLSSDNGHQQSIDELDALIDSKERRYRRLEKRRKAGSSTRSPLSSPPTKNSSSSLKRALAHKEEEIAELSARQQQLLAALATANEQETLAKRQIQETETQRQKDISRYEDLLEQLNTVKQENWNLSLALHQRDRRRSVAFIQLVRSLCSARRKVDSHGLVLHATLNMVKSSDVSLGSKGSKGSKGSEMMSWRVLSFGRRSIGRSTGRVHSNFSLHTRLASVVVEDRQDAFDPKATLVKVWEQVLLLCLLHESFLLPYFLAFQPEAVEKVSMLFVVVIICEVVFAVDLYVRANTGYYSDGNLIRDTKRTIKKYVRSRRFVLDVVAILPTQILVTWYPHQVVKLLSVKLLRWSRFPHLVSNLDEFYAKHFVVLKLLKVLASTVYLAHVLACIRYSFGEDKSHTNTWLPPDSSESSMHSRSLHRQYLTSLFWSVGIMTGLFEGELPKRATEFLFTILVALCGFSMFTTLCATIFVISKCESDNAEAMGARINQLVHVLSFHRVPEKQQAKAIEYLKRYYTDAESTDRETAKLLCPSIANDIQVELLKSTIAHVSLFGGCSDQFIVALTSLLEIIAVPAQTTLFSAGDYGDAMYVVHSGVLT
ncbi:hypothetical protein PF011_g3230 [Phytophthora fragariae]|uniref:Cyclic nucleotide-binding domain-containing protein n=1 Tax=Phytophthora fragariae TaxID=53985 RepID=A0A6A3M0N2_9STRA|nr:hypothetical protein PF011_g3230 [Phytophthora fragariae]